MRTAVSSSRQQIWVTVVALAAAGLVAVALVAGGEQGVPASAGASLEDPSLGAPDAPVELIEYSDFGCPYCANHARDVKPEIVERYVETGVVRYVWRDLPYQGDASVRAAVAARAAQVQDEFWAFHDALFATQEQGLSAERLREVAAEVGLDLDAYDQAVAQGVGEPAVEAGMADGQELSLAGTPTFLVNGQTISGAQPFEVFEQVIEEAAATAGG